MSGDHSNLEYLPWRAPEVDDSRHLRPADVESARKLAWEQGYEDGYSIAMEAGTLDARQRMAYLHEILESLGKPFRDLDDNVSSQLAVLVQSVAEQLLRRELELDSGHLRNIVTECLRALPVSSADVEIVVHPDDAALIEEHLAETSQRSWRIRRDPKQKRGGCLFVSDVAQIDASIETRLKRIVENMLSGEAEDADS